MKKGKRTRQQMEKKKGIKEQLQPGRSKSMIETFGV
jgi:hypothetical protein